MKEKLKEVIEKVYGELHGRLLTIMNEDGGFAPRLLCAAPVPGGLAIQVMTMDGAEPGIAAGIFSEMIGDPDYLFVGMAAMGCMAVLPKGEPEEETAKAEPVKSISDLKGAEDIAFFQFHSGGEILIACCKMDRAGKTFEKAPLVQPESQLEMLSKEETPDAPPPGTTIH